MCVCALSETSSPVREVDVIDIWSDRQEESSAAVNNLEIELLLRDGIEREIEKRLDLEEG